MAAQNMLNISVVGRQSTRQKVLQIAADLLASDNSKCNLPDGLNTGIDNVVLGTNTDVAKSSKHQLCETQVKVSLAQAQTTLPNPFLITSKICERIRVYAREALHTLLAIYPY